MLPSERPIKSYSVIRNYRVKTTFTHYAHSCILFIRNPMYVHNLPPRVLSSNYVIELFVIQLCVYPRGLVFQHFWIFYTSDISPKFLPLGLQRALSEHLLFLCYWFFFLYNTFTCNSWHFENVQRHLNFNMHIYNCQQNNYLKPFEKNKK